MKRTLKRLWIAWFVLCLPQMFGLHGPATDAVLYHSLKWDSEDLTPRRAVLAGDTVFMEYAVGAPSKDFQIRVADSYWASIPMRVVDSEEEGRWRIYRRPDPPISGVDSLPQIPIVQLGDYQTPDPKTFLNKDSLLTYVIDNYKLPKPVIILDMSVPMEYGFHLVGARKLHDSYRGHWNLPRGQFVHKPTFIAHAWKLPFACLLDYPAVAFIYLFAPRWPT